MNSIQIRDDKGMASYIALHLALLTPAANFKLICHSCIYVRIIKTGNCTKKALVDRPGDTTSRSHCDKERE